MKYQQLLGSVALGLLAFATPTIAADLDEYTPDWTWYVRGDVGIGRYMMGDITQEQLEPDSFEASCCGVQSLGDTVYLDTGVGLQVNRFLRFDVTGEYRSTAQMKAIDYFNEIGDISDPSVVNTTYSTMMEANHTALVGLINGYYDVTKFHGITPYVGAGIGMAYNNLSGFSGTSDSTTFYNTNLEESHHYALSSQDNGQFNLAYALMAGVSYDIIPNAKLDLGYRYINLGTDVAASTDIINCTCNLLQPESPLQIRRLDAHEIRMGIRWEFGYGNNEDHTNLKSPY